MKKILFTNLFVFSLILGTKAQTFKVEKTKTPTANVLLLLGKPSGSNNYETPYESDENIYEQKTTNNTNEIYFKNNTSQIKIVTIYFRSGNEWRILNSYRVFEDEVFTIEKSNNEFFSDYGYLVEGSIFKEIRNCTQSNTLY